MGIVERLRGAWAARGQPVGDLGSRVIPLGGTRSVYGLIEDAFCQGAHLEEAGDHAGWYDTMAISTWADLGDWLVAQGEWERHPEGHGRRWFYRPLRETDDG